MKVWVASFEVYLGYEENPHRRDVQVFTTEKLADDYLDDMEKQVKKLYEYSDEGPYSYIPYLFRRELTDKPSDLVNVYIEKEKLS